MKDVCRIKVKGMETKKGCMTKDYGRRVKDGGCV